MQSRAEKVMRILLNYNNHQRENNAQFIFYQLISQLIFSRKCWEISLKKLHLDIEPFLLILLIFGCPF